MSATSGTDRRGALRLAAGAAAASLLPLAAPALGQRGELRFGLTAVVIRENVQAFNRLGEFLTPRLGRAVSFVHRRSYADVMDLLRRGELDAAWICGYPFIQRRTPEHLELLAVPVYRGAPLYRSYVIVPEESASASLAELKGRVFAYSDPDSNSGYLAPRAMMRETGLDPEAHFRTSFFTYSHAETVMAVAERMADGGAVDSYVHDLLHRIKPEMAARTRVVQRSRQFGFPPLVSHLSLPEEVRARLQATLTGMAGDDDGKAMLARLGLDGFIESSPALYDSIRALARGAAAGVAASGEVAAK